mmetsp:Transcript_16914/g.41580  ORF Transcript_16914/g.41580 Transcript_16914/m.41580 type:complete len:250 (-) Transcript_16914:122-871(-)
MSNSECNFTLDELSKMNFKKMGHQNRSNVQFFNSITHNMNCIEKKQYKKRKIVFLNNFIKYIKKVIRISFQSQMSFVSNCFKNDEVYSAYVILNCFVILRLLGVLKKKIAVCSLNYSYSKLNDCNSYKNIFYKSSIFGKLSKLNANNLQIKTFFNFLFLKVNRLQDNNYYVLAQNYRILTRTKFIIVCTNNNVQYHFKTNKTNTEAVLKLISDLSLDFLRIISFGDYRIQKFIINCMYIIIYIFSACIQ